MTEDKSNFVKDVVRLLEEKIRGIREGRIDDYNDGVIDGLIIAIRTVEG